MKKISILVLMTLMTSPALFAQRFAYVDTDYILEKIPEYKQAQQKLDEIAAQWQAEIDRQYAEIDKLYKAYQAEQVLLTEEMKIQRQKEIEEKEKAVREYQKQKFGYKGELFQKRQELIKPIQDKIYEKVQELAKSKSYDFIFDRASGPLMLYANSRYDMSDEILRALGISTTPATDK